MNSRYPLNRRAFLCRAGAVAAGCIAPLAFTRSVWAQGKADVIFSGGTIITMDTATPRAEALAVQGGRIMAVGNMDDLVGLSGSNTRLVYLDGRTMTPGLFDPHMHTSMVQLDAFVDAGIFANDSYDDVTARLRASVSETAPGEWVYGANYDPVLIKGAKVPTLAELDALAPDNPFFLLESNGHVAYTNSLGFQALGITRDTPDPATARYVRDTNGELTGRLEEPAAYMPFIAAMPRLSPEEYATHIRAVFDKASTLGVTAMQDMSIGALTGGSGDIDILNAVMAGAPPIRFRGALQSTQMDIWNNLGVSPNQGNDMLRFNKIKAWSDGSNQGFSGFQRENYLGNGSWAAGVVSF